MAPGQKIYMRWITLWKSSNQYVSGHSDYSNLWKDFIVCDDGKINYEYVFLGVVRTPGKTDNPIKLNETDGVILHFQFVSWHKNQLKQAWYRCAELIKGERGAKRINNAYRITLDDKKIKITKTPAEWIEGISIPQGIEAVPSGWHLEAIFNFFDKYGIEFFEPLQIWHIKELHDEFLKREKREPKSKTFPRFLVWANDIKNYLKNKY
jgi:hypothetical protein